ncbi:MAG: tetratricopeptide repeat protein [Dysgonomonas sp.]
MRILIITIFIIFSLSASVYGQRRSIKDIASIEVTQPDVRRAQNCDMALTITKITIDDQCTKIDFVYRPDNPYGVNIPRQPHLYLQIKADDGNIYKALETGGMRNYGNNVKRDKPEWFSVIFEKMPFDIIAFDVVEGKAIEGVYKLPKWNFYDVRIKTETQIRAEINRLKKEAENGDADAAYELALKYDKGKEVPKDKDLSIKYYQLSAQNGNADAKYFVALAIMDGSLSGEPSQAFTFLTDAANNGMPDAQYMVGSCYYQGYGVNQDLNLALEWYTKGAENGNANAQYMVGLAYTNSSKYNEAYQWYKKSAEQGNAYAQKELGVLYYWGRGVVEDNDLAFEWFSKSAKNGYSWGQYWLGSMYQSGYGTSKNRDTALEWYRVSLSSDSDDALKSAVYNAMGNLFYEKDYAGGNSYDINQAIKYYNMAAELNNLNATYSLGLMHKSGDGVLKNPTKAKEYLTKSAEGGLNTAQYELAMLYKDANDLQTAFKWFEKSAQNKYAPAQYELGLMYYYGKGVTKNNKTAANWIENAYNAGNEDAKKVWNGLELWKYK